MMRFTQQGVRQLPTQKRAYVVWDMVQVGLGLRVYPDGRREYLVKSLTEQGEMQRIGGVELLSVKAARETVRALFQQGVPAIRSSPRFDVFIAQSWQSEVAAHWKPTTQLTVDSAMKNRLLPTFGQYPLHLITHAQVLAWFNTVSHDYPGGANRNLEVLSSVFRHAVMLGHCDENPALGIRKNRRRQITRFLSLKEIGRLNAVLDQRCLESQKAQQCSDIIRLLLLTGCRLSEIAMLTQNEVVGDELHLADSKTGARVVALGQAASAILCRYTRQGHLFPMNKGASVYVVNVFWQGVRREAGLEDVRLHDLRHTFASYAVKAGYTLPMVGRLLGHKRLSSTLRYTHVSDRRVEAAAERMGNIISQIVTPPHKPSEKCITVTLTPKAHATLVNEAASVQLSPAEWASRELRSSAKITLMRPVLRSTSMEGSELELTSESETAVLVTLSAAEYGVYRRLAERAALSLEACCRQWLLSSLMLASFGH